MSSANLTILASGTLLELLGWVKIQLLVVAFSVLWEQPACQLEAKERDGEKRHIPDNKGWTLPPPILQVSPSEFPCSVVHLFVCLICFREASVPGNGMFWFLPTVIHWLATGCVTLNLTAVFLQVECFYV